MDQNNSSLYLIGNASLIHTYIHTYVQHTYIRTYNIRIVSVVFYFCYIIIPLSLRTT